MPDHDYIAAALARRTATAPIIQPQVVQPTAGGVIKTSGGNAIDSIGVLSANILSIVASGNANTADTVNVNQYTIVPSTAVSFTLTRAAQILVLCHTVASTAGASGQRSSANIAIDGTGGLIGSLGTWDKNNTGVTSCTIVGATNVSAGNHSAALAVIAEVGQTWTQYTTFFYVFLMGS